MPFEIRFTDDGDASLRILEENPSLKKRLKAVRKALSHLAQNPRHPALNSHKYDSLSQKWGIEVFEAYAENHTPGAYRIFWRYGPEKGTITVVDIVPHP